MKRNQLFVAALSLLLLLAACAQAPEEPAAPRGDRVTDAQLAELREEYPCVDSLYGVAVQYAPAQEEQTFAEFYANGSVTAVVEVTLAEEWYDVGGAVSIFGDEEKDAYLPQFGTATYHVIDAEIEQVLWGGEDLAAGETITLSFGSTLLNSPSRQEAAFVAGERYVMIVQEWPDNPAGAPHFYRAGENASFYLTDDDVVLSVSSQAAAEEASGLYLDTFTDKVLSTFDGVEPYTAAEAAP